MDDGDPASYSTASRVNNIASPLQLSIVTERDEVKTDEANNLWAMIKLETKDTGYAFGVKERIPFDFVVVIDVSKSMKNNGKLIAALGTLEYMLDNLTEKDRFALVQFNDIATLLIELTPMTDENKLLVKEVLFNIEASGNTNTNDGLCTGLSVLDSRTEPNPPVSRLFLLTDGLSNRGLTHRKIGRNLRERRVDESLTIYSFGYGEDHSSSALQAIAFCTSGGLYYYVKNARKIASTFGECLAGIFSTVAYSIKMSLEAFDGCRFVKIRTKYSFSTIQSMKQYKGTLGSMYEQEKRTILMRLSLRAYKTSSTHQLFRVIVNYKSAIDNTAYTEEQIVSVTRVSSLCNPTPSIPLELDKQINRVISAEAIDNAISSAADQSFGCAQQTLLNAIKKISSSSSAVDPYCLDLITDLTECVKKFSGPEVYVGSRVHQVHQLSTMYNQERSVGVTAKNHISANYGYITEQQQVEKEKAAMIVNGYISSYIASET